MSKKSGTKSYSAELREKGFATGIGEPFFLTDFIEVGAKEFPIDQGIEFGKEVIELIDFSSWFSTSKNEGGRWYMTVKKE